MRQLNHIRWIDFKVIMIVVVMFHIFGNYVAMAHDFDIGAGINGRWQNVDRDTDGIVELIAETGKSGLLTLEISSACEPSPCWCSPITIAWNGLFPFTAEYHNHFKLVTLTFYTEADGFLYIHTVNSFFDAPERDYEASFRMRRE